jgi:hypothetical protein
MLHEALDNLHALHCEAIGLVDRAMTSSNQEPVKASLVARKDHRWGVQQQQHCKSKGKTNKVSIHPLN